MVYRRPWSVEVHGPWRLDGLIAVIDWCWSTYVKDTTSSHVEYPPSVAADARQTNATPTPRGGHLSQFSPLHVEIIASYSPDARQTNALFVSKSDGDGNGWPANDQWLWLWQ
jgi:hypothetical protein